MSHERFDLLSQRLKDFDCTEHISEKHIFIYIYIYIYIFKYICIHAPCPSANVQICQAVEWTFHVFASKKAPFSMPPLLVASDNFMPISARE